MTLYFLTQQTQAWKDKYIKSMVTLSGVWGGSIKAIKVYAIGNKENSYYQFSKCSFKNTFQFIFT